MHTIHISTRALVTRHWVLIPLICLVLITSLISPVAAKCVICITVNNLTNVELEYFTRMEGSDAQDMRHVLDSPPFGNQDGVVDPVEVSRFVSDQENASADSIEYLRIDGKSPDTILERKIYLSYAEGDVDSADTILWDERARFRWESLDRGSNDHWIDFRSATEDTPLIVFAPGGWRVRETINLRDPSILEDGSQLFGLTMGEDVSIRISRAGSSEDFLGAKAVSIPVWTILVLIAVLVAVGGITYHRRYRRKGP